MEGRITIEPESQHSVVINANGKRFTAELVGGDFVISSEDHSDIGVKMQNSDDAFGYAEEQITSYLIIR